MIRAMMAAMVLFVATSAHAAGDAAADLIKVLSGINSMQASFAQRTTDAKGRALPTQSGKMSVKRPGMFRWEVQKPDHQLVLTSGKVLWIYDPDLLQATRQELSDQVGNTPALLLSGDPRKLTQAFDISAEEGGDGERVFTLKPRAKDALFEDLRVRFRSGAMVQMELGDTLGQRTEISFGNIQLNPVFSAGLFDFVPPKGVDVIDQF
jgi:outer membrane lipoprotein carrier protein